MAKRTPPEEQEYRPVNEQLARNVLTRRAHRSTPEPQIVESPEQDGTLETAHPGDDETLPEPVSEAQSAAALKVLRSKRGGRGNEQPKEPTRAKRKEMVSEKRMLLSEDEDRLFEELVSGISRELRVKVKASNVLRACLTLLNHVQVELLKQCRRMDPPQRPRYDDPTSIQVFEEHLARLFDSAVRNTKSLD
jgi:hypothetical protein